MTAITTTLNIDDVLSQPMSKENRCLEALINAVNNHHLGLMWKLCQTAMAEKVDLSAFILFYVIYWGKIEAIDYLFGEKRLDLNLRWTECEFTVLMQACRQGKREVVKLLLAWGADVEQTDFRGQNAFFYATMFKDADIFRLLFDQTGRIDYVDNEGRTLLHCMCGYPERSKEVFDEIIDLDLLDVNAQDHLGNTPLHLEVKFFSSRREHELSTHRIMTLLKHPAIDLSITNQDADTAWDLCKGNKKMTEEIRRKFKLQRYLALFD